MTKHGFQFIELKQNVYEISSYNENINMFHSPQILTWKHECKIINGNMYICIFYFTHTI